LMIALASYGRSAPEVCLLWTYTKVRRTSDD
jgi:hypothetical protein